MFDKLKYAEILDFIKKNNKNCQIIAISKNQTKESVVQAINSGVNIFGENKVMEAKEKFSQLKITQPNLELHLTGPLQSNKVKLASSLFDVFHTLDREKIAKEFSKNSDKIKDKKFFIQVNIGEEKTKSGIGLKELSDFVKYCKNDMSINVIGLMCLPPIDEDPHPHFKKLKQIAINNNLEKLSIGMSNDYKIALNFNPTYIRLGTILFGKRN